MKTRFTPARSRAGAISSLFSLLWQFWKWKKGENTEETNSPFESPLLRGILSLEKLASYPFVTKSVFGMQTFCVILWWRPWHPLLTSEVGILLKHKRKLKGDLTHMNVRKWCIVLPIARFVLWIIPNHPWPGHAQFGIPNSSIPQALNQY